MSSVPLDPLSQPLETIEAVPDKPAPARPAHKDPEHIGPFRILERIGEGGMGIVYKAEQREPVRRPPHRKGTGKRRPTMFKHFRVDDLLRPDERDDYVALALLPPTTLPQLKAWLAARGHNVHRSSISRHRAWLWQHHGAAVEQARRVAATTANAAAIAAATRAGPDLSEVAAARLEALLLDRLDELAKAKPRDEHAIGLAMKAFGMLVSARQRLGRMNAGRADRDARTAASAEEAARLAAQAAKPPLTQEEQDNRMRAKIEYIMRNGSAEGFDENAATHSRSRRCTDPKIREAVRRWRRLVGFTEEEFPLDPPPTPPVSPEWFRETDEDDAAQDDRVATSDESPDPAPQPADSPAPPESSPAPAEPPPPTLPIGQPWLNEKSWEPPRSENV